ncbi:hypothetical protein D3C78_1822060 [compost metagenome]
MRHQLMLMRQENGQAVWRPFIIIINTRDELTGRLQNRLVSHRARTGIHVIVNIFDPRIAQLFNELL